ncbi:glycosyltransferase [Candidatus Roizmanbacteria bacterium]|nr:glycosyltransferase [Candidatus Roizmanbacteria bacterium]
MNILYFTYDIPYPLNSGGKIRAYYLLRALSKHHKVTLFSFYRTEEQRKLLGNLEKYCHAIKLVKRRPLHSFATFLYLPYFPFPAALYYSPSVYRLLRNETIQGKYDALHIESFYTSMYSDGDFPIPTVLGTENIEWHVYDAYAKQQRAIGIHQLLQWEVSRIKKFEEHTWRMATKCLAVSKENAEEIQKVTAKPCVVIPNGVNTSEFTPIQQSVKKSPYTLTFVGNINYLQNKDAAGWLIADIWPKVHHLLNEEGIASRLLIAGAATDELRARTKDPHISILGEVSDIRSVYKKTDVVLAPLRIGSGTKFKILEAAACAIPVVTTPTGCEGLTGMTHEHELLVATDAESIAASIKRIATSDSLGRRLAQNAHKRVVASYSWDAIGSRLVAVYEELINHHR